MRDNLISREIQIEMMKFFMVTSVPRILELGVKSNFNGLEV